jgi:hypothetical protein
VPSSGFSASFRCRTTRPTWRDVKLARQTLGEQTWEVKAVQVYLMRRRQPTERTYQLIVARDPATGEVKYTSRGKE